MIPFVKRTAKYCAAAITVMLAAKKGFESTITWQIFAWSTSVGCVICVLFAWIESFWWSTDEASQPSRPADAGSLSLALKRATSQVTIAPRADEKTALLASRIVHKLDKKCISYAEYKVWRDKNPSIFTAVVSGDNELIGFFDVFPLTEQAGEQLYSGRIKERELSAASILPSDQASSAKFVYVASVMVNPSQNALNRLVAKEVVLLKLAEFLLENYPPDSKRTVFAYAHTRQGEAVLRNSGFQNKLLAEHCAQRDPLYELPADTYTELVEVFRDFLSERASGRRMASTRRRRARGHFPAPAAAAK